MNTLPFTIALVMLLAILSLSSLQQAVDRGATAFALESHHNATRSLHNNFQNAFYQLKIQESLRSNTPRERQSNPTSSTPTTSHQRHPLPEFPSRLNLNALLEPGDSPRKTLYSTLLVKLLDTLHPDQHTLNTQIVTELANRLPDANITHAEQLATLHLGDLHAAYVHLLRTDLLDLLTLSEHAINIAHAPRPLLVALFESDAIADNVIAYRNTLIHSYNTETTETAAAASQAAKSAQLQTYTQQLLSSRPELLDLYTPELSYQLYYRPSELTISATDRIHLRRHHHSQIRADA